jgi:trehalose 6-phosphate phosphatase
MPLQANTTIPAALLTEIVGKVLFRTEGSNDETVAAIRSPVGAGAGHRCRMIKTRTPPPPDAQAAWAYFLDFDGTLLDLAETPDRIHVDAALILLLDQLFLSCGGALALISGRALSDLDRRLGHAVMPRAGQHGLERRDATGRLWLHSAPPEIKRSIYQALQPVLKNHPGLLLEDKGLSVALHYRRAPQLASYAHRLMRRLTAETGGLLELQCGKCVIEAKPAGFNKGSAIVEYLAEPPFNSRRPVFIGDDLNDECAFAAVNDAGGISIKVGKGRTGASYRLADVVSVRRWLGGALDTKHA